MRTNNTFTEYYNPKNQPSVLQKDRRNSEYCRYRETIEKLKQISEKLEHFSDSIDGIFVK